MLYLFLTCPVFINSSQRLGFFPFLCFATSAPPYWQKHRTTGHKQVSDVHVKPGRLELHVLYNSRTEKDPAKHRRGSQILYACLKNLRTEVDVLKLWAPERGGGGVGPLRGMSCLYDGHVYLDEIWTQNLYFGRHFAWLKYFTYHLVPVLAPNNKQHILSPVKLASFLCRNTATNKN
jgi:hypothetical protein